MLERGGGWGHIEIFVNVYGSFEERWELSMRERKTRRKERKTEKKDAESSIVSLNGGYKAVRRCITTTTTTTR